jgi:hypothetical protein
MKDGTEAVLLRVFVGESDRWHGQPLHMAVLQEARRQGLAGGTVVRGMEGFGAASVIHTTRFLEMSSDLPIVVEIVDAEEKVNAFVETLGDMIGGGLVTTERVKVVFYRHGDK